MEPTAGYRVLIHISCCALSRGTSALHQHLILSMATYEFRDLAIGDEFRLDGRLYQKRAKYSARLICDDSGNRPGIGINRMIHPDSAVETDLASNAFRLDRDTD